MMTNIVKKKKKKTKSAKKIYCTKIRLTLPVVLTANSVGHVQLPNATETGLPLKNWHFWWVPGGSVRPCPPRFKTLGGTCGITLGQIHSDLSPPPPSFLHRCLCTEASSVGGVVGSRLGTHSSTTWKTDWVCHHMLLRKRGDGWRVGKKKGRQEGANVPLTGLWEVLLGSSTGSCTYRGVKM